MDATEGFDLGKDFWPVYWGFVISLFLAGITIVQAYLYFPHPSDRMGLQLTAATMLILDVASSALVAQSIYYYLLPHFGSESPLKSVTPELAAECLISTIITLISQLYFVYQIYTLKRLVKLTPGRWMLVVSCIACAFIAFAGGIGCVTSMIVYHNGVLFVRNHFFSIFFGIAKAFGALTDILATIAMSLLLKSSSSGMESTNKILKTLVQFVVQRGFAVTLAQTLMVILFYCMPSSLLWFGFHVNVTKLYANTFFAMLNGRSHLKRASVSRVHYHSHTLSNSGLSIQASGSVTGLGKISSTKFGGEPVQTPSSPVWRTQTPATVMEMQMPTITKTVVVSDL